MSKHTPLPWEVCNLTDLFSSSGAKNADGVRADHNDGWQIADCLVGLTFVNGEMESLDVDEQRSNAEFICRAANSHYELVQELTKLRDKFNENYTNFLIVDRINKVLAKAKGETA